MENRLGGKSFLRRLERLFDLSGIAGLKVVVSRSRRAYEGVWAGSITPLTFIDSPGTLFTFSNASLASLHS